MSWPQIFVLKRLFYVLINCVKNYIALNLLGQLPHHTTFNRESWISQVLQSGKCLKIRYTETVPKISEVEFRFRYSFFVLSYYVTLSLRHSKGGRSRSRHFGVTSFELNRNHSQHLSWDKRLVTSLQEEEVWRHFKPYEDLRPSQDLCQPPDLVQTFETVQAYNWTFYIRWIRFKTVISEWK